MIDRYLWDPCHSANKTGTERKIPTKYLPFLTLYSVRYIDFEIMYTHNEPPYTWMGDENSPVILHGD